MRGGLTRRTVLASAVLALLVGAAFAVLIRAVTEERDSADQAIRSQEVIAAANRLERLVLDLETGQRGFRSPGTSGSSNPGSPRADAYPRLADALETATGGGPDGQAEAARNITAAIDAYIDRYSVPLVEAARRRRRPPRRASAALEQGKRRVDAPAPPVRRVRRRRAGAVRSRATRAPTPTRSGRSSCAAAGLAGLDPAHRAVRRVPDRGRSRCPSGGRPRWPAGSPAATCPRACPRPAPGEVGALERAFNTMAASLGEQPRRAAPDRGGAGRAPARRHAGGARRAAPTSCSTPSPRRCGPCSARTARRCCATRTTDTVAFLAGGVGRAARHPPGTRLTLDERDARRARCCAPAGRPAMDDDEKRRGPTAGDGRERASAPRWARRSSSRARLWGVMVATWRRPTAPAPDVEERWRSSPSSSPPRSPTRRAAPSSPPHARGSSPRPTRRAAGSSATSTTAPSRASSTRSSRSSSRGEGSETRRAGGRAVDEALGHAERANAELRELAHGILPATLTRRARRRRRDAGVARAAAGVPST